MIRQREKKRRDRISGRPLFREGRQDANGRLRVAPYERLNAVRGSRLCGYVSGNYKNASGQQYGQSHTGFDAR